MVIFSDNEASEIEKALIVSRIGVEKLRQALAEKDREIEHLKEKVAHYDRWLSKGVYFTNEEFSEQVLKPKQQLMEKAVGFALLLAADNGFIDCNVALFLKSPEAQAFLKERGA